MANQNPTFVLPDPASDKARSYMRGLRRAVLSFWYATRDHVFIAGQPGLERVVERYLRGRLGPVFEG